MRTLILANGDAPTSALLNELIESHELFIATDGGANTAMNLGVTPHIVCGDFDSIRMEEAITKFPETAFVSTPDQNMADLEKAIQLARERGATAITIAGASGGRIDHHLANYGLLLKYAHSRGLLSIREEYSEVWGVVDDVEIVTQRGDTISLIAMESVSGVSISGVEWPLEDVSLHIGTQGVSNIAQAESVRVSVRSGRLLLCRMKQSA